MEAEQTQKNFKENLIAAATGSTLPPPVRAKWEGSNTAKTSMLTKKEK